MENNIKYLEVSDGIITYSSANNFKKLLNKKFNNKLYDIREWLFKRYPDIVAVVKDESIFTDEPTIFFDDEFLCGIVIFVKMNEEGFVNLTKSESTFIKNHLIPIGNKQFKLVK